MKRPRRSPKVRSQIRAVLRHTQREFGHWKYRQYQDLIREALDALAKNPEAGRSRSDIAPDAWDYHIKKEGRRARHLFLYFIADDGVAEIVAFVYDAMDLPETMAERPLNFTC